MHFLSRQVLARLPDEAALRLLLCEVHLACGKMGQFSEGSPATFIHIEIRLQQSPRRVNVCMHTWNDFIRNASWGRCCWVRGIGYSAALAAIVAEVQGSSSAWKCQGTRRAWGFVCVCGRGHGLDPLSTKTQRQNTQHRRGRKTTRLNY